MALTKPLVPVWIFMLEAFGRDRDLHSSGGMEDECVKCHSRLAELIANEKGLKVTQAQFPG